MQVFGILNATPDSFSDGGKYNEVTSALRHAQDLVSEGATAIDVGGESTRPGAAPVSPLEEQRRVMTIIEALVANQIVVSVDTRHSQTARLALAAGVTYINDVSGGTADPLMIPLAVEMDAQYVAMHWGGGADSAPPPGNAADMVARSLTATAARLESAGMDSQRIILDPGLGFGKSVAQNWELIGMLPRLLDIGPRLLIGHSRKRFIANLLPAKTTTSVTDAASAAVSVLCQLAGVWGVRVHNAMATSQLLTAAALTIAE